MERRIIHLNIADFSVAIERLLDRTLVARPLIIAEPSARAVVYDMSDEAYLDGVRKGMLLTVARRRCRQARILPPRPAQYQKALQRCLEHARYYTPLVAPSSGNGHLYLDVTGTHRLFGPPPDIGWRLRNSLRRDLGLDPIWSVAPNKLLAKVASRLVKPRGEYIVAGGEEQSFLSPLPLTLLPGLLPGDLRQLAQVNIRRVHQLMALSVQDLSVLCQHRARFLYQVGRGIDPSPVHAGETAGRRLCFRHLLTPDSNQDSVLRAIVSTLVRQAGYALRQQGLACRGVSVALQYTDGVSGVRQAVSKQPVGDDPSLEQLAVTAFYRVWRRRVRIRQLSLACSRLQHPVEQLRLFSSDPALPRKNQQISLALDCIQERYGAGTMYRGRQQPLRMGQ